MAFLAIMIIAGGSLQREGSPQVLAKWDDGRGNLGRPPRGTFPLTGDHNGLFVCLFLLLMLSLSQAITIVLQSPYSGWQWFCAESKWYSWPKSLTFPRSNTFVVFVVKLSYQYYVKHNFQAARKFDIPYPTFVLYANRVHNMLGPTPLGVSEMRPKVCYHQVMQGLGFKMQW